MRKSVFLGMAMAFALTIPTYAAGWMQDSVGYWWQNDDGSYPVSCWQWLDGNKDGVAECYYFYDNGYMAANTEVDGYLVDANGAWMLDGQIQTQSVIVTDQEQNNDANALVESSGNIYDCGLEGDVVIDISEQLGEEGWISLDDAVCFWQLTPEAGEDYLDYRLGGFLSEASVNKIKNQLMTAYPHTNTVPYEQLFN